MQCAVENAKFFLGTDSAPHTVGKKECPCGCAGCFTAHMSIEMVAEAFESWHYVVASRMHWYYDFTPGAAAANNSRMPLMFCR